jgi:hypothetical protein
MRQSRSNIPEPELMAEKLGIIDLCENCGQRIIRVDDEQVSEFVRSLANLSMEETVWMHENTRKLRCNPKQTIKSFLAKPLTQERDR